MNSEFTHEQIEKIKECKNVEELTVLAKANGIELTEAMATNLFAQFNPTNSMLSDNELEAVTGGCDVKTPSDTPPKRSCPKCSSNNTKYLFSYSDGYDIDYPSYFYRCNQCHYEFCFRKQ